jgi:hypothetical protein
MKPYKAHFVGEDAILSIPPIVVQPIETVNLRDGLSVTQKQNPKNITANLKRHKFQMVTLAKIRLRIALQHVFPPEVILRTLV